MHGCPDCVHQYPSLFGKMLHLGSRRQLPADSPIRSRRCGPYQFIDEERRAPALIRTTELLKQCLQVCSDSNLQHVCGFSGTPMFMNRIDFDLLLENVPDLMHLLGRVFTFGIGITCGGHGKSSRAENWSKSGIVKAGTVSAT